MSTAKKIYQMLPAKYRDTILLRSFGLFKVPLLFWLRPSVVELSDENCVIKIPFKRRSKNHLGSMYFGVLACGADCAGGLAAMKMIIDSGESVSLAFKDFDAKFLKRPEADVYFSCSQGVEIKSFVKQVVVSGERHNMPVVITATCPDKFGDEAVATFTLTLSLKKKQPS
jgi:acyl-coenzyme A thioesterase PaaI-like protein